MRYLLFFSSLLLLFYSTASKSQSLTNLYLTKRSDGTFRLIVNTMFFSGDGQVHFQESIGHDTTYQNDTLKFRLFYPAIMGFTYTDYVDTFDLGYITPNSANVFTLYRLVAHETSPGIWDTSAFYEPYTDTSLLFPWVTSLLEMGMRSSLDVYPNPVSTEAYVSVGYDFSGECVLELSDHSGRVLFKTSYIVASNPIKLNMRDYTRGVYLVTISDKNSRRKTARVNKL